MIDKKILLVNTKQKGGAAISCRRLLQGLRSINADANLLVRDKAFGEVATHAFSVSSYWSRVNKYYQFLKKKSGFRSNQDNFLDSRTKNGLEYYSFPHSSYDITESEHYVNTDIINLHWVAGFLDYKTFFKKNKKPVIWTLHDMNPFTGGEHYEEIYYGINESGHPVSRIKSPEEILYDNKNLKIKMKAFSCCDNLSIVAPSKWLAEQASKSELLKGRTVFHIPYGLDETVFQPRDKFFSRHVLGLPQDATVLLFVADSISNQRKGFNYLIRALEAIHKRDVILCAVGSQHKLESASLGIKYLGHVSDELMMSIIYSAVDAFIIPSLMDNLPNTVLESQMCGTPVIGFNVGGIPDMIEVNKTGLLCEDISVDAMIDQISKFITGGIKFEKSYIRNSAESKYSLNLQAERYLNVINGTLSQ
jgi:glycosyltransferase involved in cell wall biosynthesis